MSKPLLILGDILAIALVTILGFATHGETGLSFVPRMGATFFPLAIAWFLLAPRLGLFQDEIIHQARQLWRPALTAFFAAPMAAVLRGLMLNAPVIPIFAIVLGAASAVGMVIWRLIWYWIGRHPRTDTVS
jgi:flagellar biosynthesis protein FliQ